MGYYGDFKVNISRTQKCKDENTIMDVINSLAIIVDDCIKDDVSIDDSDSNSAFIYLNGWKWYNCERDLLRLSQMYPEWKIEVCVEGEDREDTWEAVFLNGKERRRDIVFAWSEWKEIDYSKYK